MGGRRILSDDQIEEMADLRARNWSHRRIAEYFTAAGTAISVGSIAWQCLRVGADAPPRFRGKNAQPSKPYLRPNGAIVRPFSPEEDAQLLALRIEGLSYVEIGRRLGRRQNSVIGRLFTLARIDARREEGSADAPDRLPLRDRHREAHARKLQRLPGQIEAARAKLARLEAMARA